MIYPLCLLYSTGIHASMYLFVCSSFFSLFSSGRYYCSSTGLLRRQLYFSPKMSNNVNYIVFYHRSEDYYSRSVIWNQAGSINAPPPTYCRSIFNGKQHAVFSTPASHRPPEGHAPILCQWILLSVTWRGLDAPCNAIPK